MREINEIEARIKRAWPEVEEVSRCWGCWFVDFEWFGIRWQDEGAEAVITANMNHEAPLRPDELAKVSERLNCINAWLRGQKTRPSVEVERLPMQYPGCRECIDTDVILDDTGPVLRAELDYDCYAPSELRRRLEENGIAVAGEVMSDESRVRAAASRVCEQIRSLGMLDNEECLLDSVDELEALLARFSD